MTVKHILKFNCIPKKRIKNHRVFYYIDFGYKKIRISQSYYNLILNFSKNKQSLN
ncbi:hypothetical protein ACINWC692_A0133 [Acinetobacter baumannii WC-692]|nr:hypothetical protein ACINWC692_A0133 [Acinetobacter baumannii WC-692]